ncbi:type VI secretion system baseplate subunit TssK [Alkalilimnicola ehrlichii]|nr:type VI secretion system baseplate subunit TssK [Alkalilimnicola ehrlichii]
MQLMQAKVRVLSERQEASGGDLGASDLSQFLLLQTLRPALAILQHLRGNLGFHPERLFSELTQLASSLVAFRPDAKAGELPQYSHGDLTSVFQRFDEMLRVLLTDVMPKQSAGIKLQRESDALYKAENVDIRLLQGASIFLAVLHDDHDPSWVAEFARQAKCGAREDIELILSSALPGVRITHCQRPPGRLAIKSGYEYFRLEQAGDFWQRVCEHQTLALYMPLTFKGARIEIVTVNE